MAVAKCLSYGFCAFLLYALLQVQAAVAETDQPKWWERSVPNMIDIHSTQEFLSALALSLWIIERLLITFSCKVTAVDSGLRALQLLEVDGLKVDLIISDYCMPNMTGYKFLKKIKQSSKFKEIPVVIMSSDNILTLKNKCLEKGAKDFLVKPVTFLDFNKLKDYMKKDVGGVEESEINKRKLREPSDETLTLSFSAPSSPTSFDSQIKLLKRTCSI